MSLTSTMSGSSRWRTALFLLITMLCKFSAGGSCLPAPSGLVNFWPGEGNANDLLGLYTLLKGPTFEPGEVGSAFSFDGVDDILQIDAAPIPPPWTAEFWVNRQASLQDSAVLLGDRATALKLEQYRDTKKVGFTEWGIADYSFNYIAPIGTWVHLVFVGTTTNMQLYVNGELQDSLPTTLALPRGQMGNDISDRFNKPLRGLVDEVSLYDRALDSSEIASLFAAGAAGKCKAAPNDNYSDRVSLSGTNITFQAWSFGATNEPGEPQHAGSPPSHSIWFTWTAPFSGGVSLTASNHAGLKPAIAVYTGSNIADLVAVASDSGSAAFRVATVRVVFDVAADVTYAIALDVTDSGQFLDYSTFTLKLSPPPANDFIANSTFISGNFSQTAGSFVGATREPGEPDHGMPGYGQTLWWTWTAPTNTGVITSQVSLSSDAVSFPPGLSVYVGDSITNLNPVPLSLQTNGMTSIATFTANAGTTYHIALAGVQFQPGQEIISPRFGNYRFSLNNRALALTILNLATTNTFSGNGPDAVLFGADALVDNLGAATSNPLRVYVSAISGVSVTRSDNETAVGGDEVLQGIWPDTPFILSPGQSNIVHFSGAAPAPHYYPLFSNTNIAEGYGVYAQLQEQRIGTNWYTIDETLVLFGNWPRASGIISSIGPGGGVIRLDPGYIGLAPFNPVTSVGILGPLTMPEGSSLSYTGQAFYANGSIHDFTDTAWASSRFTIAPNGVFTAGSVTSNTSVLISASYSYGGFLYTASSNVIVSDLPPPTFSGLSLFANDSFTMTLSGVPGRSHVIEATTNLTPPNVWVPLATNATDTNGLLSLTNSAVTDFPRHFFRAREL